MFPVILSPYTNHHLHQSIDAPRNVAFEDGVILVADSRGDFTLLQVVTVMTVVTVMCAYSILFFIKLWEVCAWE